MTPLTPINPLFAELSDSEVIRAGFVTVYDSFDVYWHHCDTINDTIYWHHCDTISDTVSVFSQFWLFCHFCIWFRACFNSFDSFVCQCQRCHLSGVNGVTECYSVSTVSPSVTVCHRVLQCVLGVIECYSVSSVSSSGTLCDNVWHRIWPILLDFDEVWPILLDFDDIWPIYDPFMTHFDSFDWFMNQLWPILNDFDPISMNFDEFMIKWPLLMNFDKISWKKSHFGDPDGVYGVPLWSAPCPTTHYPVPPTNARHAPGHCTSCPTLSHAGVTGSPGSFWFQHEGHKPRSLVNPRLCLKKITFLVKFLCFIKSLASLICQNCQNGCFPWFSWN